MKLSSIAKKRFIVTTELNPSVGMPFAEKARDLVDGMTVPALRHRASDQSSESPEIKSIQKAAELKKAGIESAPTLACRDHPKNDGEITKTLRDGKIENAVVLWGDPHEGPNKGSYSFNDSASLIKWLSEQELGLDFVVASDPSATKKPWQISTLKKKAEAGASLTITQPIFDTGLAKRFFEKARMEVDGLKLIAGLMPLSNAKGISFVQNVLGVGVPEEAQKKVLSSDNGGFEFVLEAAEELRERVDGFHLFPLGKEDQSIELLKKLR